MKLFIATAATKKQLSNAELVFGKTGEKVVAGLEALNKVFKHPGIDSFLDFLRSSEEVVEKWATSKPGVKAIENLKIAGTAKSVDKILAAVSSLKSIPRQDKGVIIPKDDRPTYVGAYRPSVPVPSSEKGTKAGKYELTDERVKLNGKTLYRIKALKNFGKIKAGDLGGYIQAEKNLSHDGNAWVYDTAQVAGNAKVYGNAQVRGRAKVYGNAQVYGNAEVRNDAAVSDKAKVYGNARVGVRAQVFDKAQVYGNAQVTDKTEVYGNSKVFEDAEISGNAEVYGNASVYGDAKVFTDAIVYGNAHVLGTTQVMGKAQVYGKAWVSGTTWVTGDQAVTK